MGKDNWREAKKATDLISDAEWQEVYDVEPLKGIDGQLEQVTRALLLLIGELRRYHLSIHKFLSEKNEQQECCFYREESNEEVDE